jgi:hypothetical protein
MTPWIAAHRHLEVDLRAHDGGAVDAEQRLAGMHVLAGPVDEQLLDIAVNRGPGRRDDECLANAASDDLSLS